MGMGEKSYRFEQGKMKIKNLTKQILLNISKTE
jgi:hypothetical protein